jgi:tetratricopeptide (TPR) repeat protein
MILAAAVTVLPVSGLVSFNFQVYSTVADRYAYLGLIFVSIGAGLMLERASRARLVYLVVLLAAASAWMVLARQQSRTYLANEALYRRAIDTNPRSWMSLNNLAFHRLQADDPQAAFDLAQQAVAISPDYGNGLLTLGLALEKMGAFEQAVGPLERGVAILHDQALGRSVLGRVYAQLWRLDDAERELTLALKLDPSLAGAKAMLEKVREVRASTRPTAP